MKKLIKKFIDWLFEPNEYDGLSWFDVITSTVWMAGWGMLIACLINSFC